MGDPSLLVSWKAVGKAAVTGAVSGVAAGLVGSIGKDVATGWQVAARVGIEAGKQVILEGKITNVAGLVGAAASGGAFGNGTIGTAIAENSRTFSAGLAILENVARGRDNNALNWVGLATSAFFDAGDRQQSASAAASEQSSQGSQVESYQAIASTSQQGASSQYFDRAGNVNWTNVAVQAVGTVVISNRLGSEAAINYFGNALGSAVSENAYAQVQRDETRNPSSASYHNEMDRESDSVTAARVEREAYSYRNGMDVESDGATNLNAVIYAFGQDYSGLRQPGLQYAANDVMDATQPRVVSDAGPLGGTPTSGVSRDPFARDYENSFDDGSGMTTLMKDAPLRIFNNTANVYTTENLTAMPGWQIQGAGSKVLAEGMTNMGGYRDASTGQWSPYGEETVSAGIDAMVQTRGVSYEYANEHYAKFYEQTIIREGAVSQAGKELVPMLSMSAANGLPDNSAHMASPEQLRFGKMVGDSLGGLDPVFGALLSPTGGIPGAGNTRVTNSLAIGLAGGLDAVTNHGIAHDAAGYLLNYHQMGPGYQYVPNFKGWISTTSPLSGQQGGLNFYNNLKLYGTPTAPFNQNQF